MDLSKNEALELCVAWVATVFFIVFIDRRISDPSVLIGYRVFALIIGLSGTAFVLGLRRLRMSHAPEFRELLGRDEEALLPAGFRLRALGFVLRLKFLRLGDHRLDAYLLTFILLQLSAALLLTRLI